MLTTKPITTISYNTDTYLTNLLENLRKAKIITFRFFVPHKAEDDENKDHIHLYIELAKRLDTEILRDEFKEKDLSSDTDKPLSVMPFQVCNSFNDMYLYFIHDKIYLSSMNNPRKYHYNDSDIHTSDKEYLNEKRRTSPMPKCYINREMFDGLLHGEKPTHILQRNNVPMRQWGQYLTAFRMLYADLNITPKDD